MIVSQELRSPQNWTADVTPNDGKVDGAFVRSNQQIIRDNRAPVIDSMVLNTTDVTKNDTSQNLTLYFNATDADGDSIKNITNWLLNGTSIMVLNMPFEKINGTDTNNAWDYSGYGYNGSEQSGVIWNATGGFDGRGAYIFDGIDDWINLSDTPAINLTYNFSLEVWLKLNSTGPNSRQAFSRGGSTRALWLYAPNTVGWLRFGFSNSSGNSNQVFSNTVINDNRWHHVVGTYNGSSIAIFIDGVIDNVVANIQRPQFDAETTRIGSGVSESYWNGSIDELRIYNRSLSYEQIKALFNNKTNLIVSQELRSGQNWTADVTPNDGKLDGAFSRSNQVIVTAVSAASNTRPPAPVAGRPFNGSAITNRTPAFEWVNATDAEGDPISYHLQVDDNIRFTNPEINVSAILDQASVASVNTSWFSTTELNPDTSYYWRVRANDSGGFGDWSDGLAVDGPGDAPYNLSNFTVDSLLQIALVNDAVEFGSVDPGTEVNTSDGVPPPFRAENTGNVNVNATINASRYYTSLAINRSAYQFKIRANETGAFDTALSSTGYTNMTNVTTAYHVVNLTWRDAKNDFLTDINLTIPSDEPGGFKTSTVTFTFTRNE